MIEAFGGLKGAFSPLVANVHMVIRGEDIALCAELSVRKLHGRDWTSAL